MIMSEKLAYRRRVYLKEKLMKQILEKGCIGLPGNSNVRMRLIALPQHGVSGAVSTSEEKNCALSFV